MNADDCNHVDYTSSVEHRSSYHAHHKLEEYHSTECAKDKCLTIHDLRLKLDWVDIEEVVFINNVDYPEKYGDKWHYKWNDYRAAKPKNKHRHR